MNECKTPSEKSSEFRARKKFASPEELCFFLLLIKKHVLFPFGLQGTLRPNLKFKHSNYVSLSG